MEFIFEKLEEKHQKEVSDILNYYIENTTAAYRAEVGQGLCSCRISTHKP